MPRTYSLAYLTIPGTAPLEHIRIAAEAGYEYVSLRTIPMHLPGEPLFQMEKDRQLFMDVRAALAEYGLALWDIELARVREDLNVFAYEPAFEKGAELGAKHVLSSIWTEDTNHSFTRFAIICDLAAKYGMDVNLEFVPFSGVKNLMQARDVLAAVQRPNAKLMIDMLHANRAGVLPAELSTIGSGEINFIHLCDGPEGFPAYDEDSMIQVVREGRLYPGEGGAGVDAMLKALPVTPVSIELPNLKETAARGAGGHAARCLDTAKAYLASIGLP